eukprot:Seg833.1 transcript_id=Seg833.1/GoldUCD/mRNA.D3Y31 product="hypothetical protein" protein_id=Seg833.1/GoldUCD/D3Y31
MNGSTLTTLCRFRGTNNETLEHITLARMNQQSNLSWKLPIKITKTSNVSDVIILNATKISWDLDGHYLLKIMFSNGSAHTRKLILHVLDYPVMPRTNYKLCNNTNYICFHLQFPEIYSNHSLLFTKYLFNHSVRSAEQRCASYVQKNLVSCQLNSKINPPGITCKMQWLDICKDKNVVECLRPYYIMVYGVNNAGLSRSIRFQLIPPFKVMETYRLANNVTVQAASSTQLKVVWKRPKCKYMEFVYRPIYTLARGGPWTTLETTLSDSYKDAGHSFSQDITGLKPYTNYKVCVESYDEVLGSDYIKSACITKQTLEAAPSEAPSKIRPRPISTGKDTWACELVWEGVSREKLNGNVKYTIIEIRKEKEPNALAMSRIFVPIEKTRYRIEGLSRGVDYLAVLKLCTKGGCTSSKEIPILIKKNEESHSLSTSQIIAIVIGSCFLTVLLTLLVIVSIRSCLKRNNKRQRLEDDPEEIPDDDLINPRGQIPYPDEHIYNEIPEQGPADAFIQNDSYEHRYDEMQEQGPAEPFIQNSSYEGASSMEVLRDAGSFAQLQRTDAEDEDSESLELQSEISSRTYSIETDPLMPIA